MCNAALEPGVPLEKAKEMVAAAAAKYAEAAALALYNWGNVAMCEARRCIDSTAEKPAKEEQSGADAGPPPLPPPLPAETARVCFPPNCSPVGLLSHSLRIAARRRRRHARRSPPRRSATARR